MFEMPLATSLTESPAYFDEFLSVQFESIYLCHD